MILELVTQGRDIVSGPLISKDALIQAMVAAMEGRSPDDRYGLSKSDVRKFVNIIYDHSLDRDSSDMKVQIEKFLDKISGR